MRKPKQVLAMLGALLALTSCSRPGNTAPGSSVPEGQTGESTAASFAGTTGETQTAGTGESQPGGLSQTNPRVTTAGRTATAPPKTAAQTTTTTKDGTANVKQYFNAKVGMWYTVWWDSQDYDPFYYEHHWIKETRIKPVKHGYYATDDVKRLKDDFTYFTDIGIDYLILDDTNDHNADSGNIATHIKACFDMAKSMGAKAAPELCFAGGRPLINGDKEHMRAEMDVFYAFATGYKENTFFWKGKPLFVNFNIPKNYGYQDELARFTMRPAAGHVSEGKAYQYKYGIDKTGMYGWVFDIQYDNSEIYGISPGFSRSHNGLGASAPPISRENGQRFQREWLNAIKRKPEMIVISSWNDHAEETGIEAVELLEPIPGRGEEDPFFYQKITQGYLALRTGYLENWYYRSESESQVYQYKGGKLHKAAAVPAKEAVIVVPDDYFGWAGVARV